MLNDDESFPSPRCQVSVCCDDVILQGDDVMDDDGVLVHAQCYRDGLQRVFAGRSA